MQLFRDYSLQNGIDLLYNCCCNISLFIHYANMNMFDCLIL